MMASLDEIASSFSWPKLIYTVILGGVVALLLAEIRRVWLDTGVYVRGFKFFNEGKEAASNGEDFALRVLDRHAELRERFGQSERSTFENERRLLPRSDAPIQSSQSTLSELEITIQQINITDILARVRRWVSTPREISGTISKTGQAYRAYLEFGRDPVLLANDETVQPSFHLGGLESEDDAAFEVACTLVWMEAAKVENAIASVPRAEFCQWARLWASFLDIETRKQRVGRLNETDVKALEQLRIAVTSTIDHGVSYPKFYELRANIVDALPAEQRERWKAEAQSDRLRYEVLLDLDLKKRPLLADPLDSEKAFERLAEARPAILVHAGVLEGEIAEEWKRVLKPSAETIQRASRASGLFRIISPDGIPLEHEAKLVGFAVGKNLIATINFNILPSALRQTNAPAVYQMTAGFKGEFTFHDAWSDEPSSLHPIKRVLSLNGNDRTGMVLLEIEGHDVNAHPPLGLGRDSIESLHEGEFVAIVGYPERDPRLPDPFIEKLLGGVTGVKRLLPGRIVGIPLQTPASGEGTRAFGDMLQVDCSTTGGTSGGPLVHLHTGNVIGMHSSGQWKDIREGKYAYALPTDGFFSETVALRTIRNLQPGQPALDQIIAALPPGSVQPIALAAVAEVQPLVSDIDTQPKSGYDPGFLSGGRVELPKLSAGVAADALQGGAPLDYVHFSLVMNQKRRFALLAASNVDASQYRLIPRRRDVWKLDPRVPLEAQANEDLFKQNSLDRGNLVRRTDVTWGDQATAEAASQAVFHYTNAIPQHSQMNQRSWLQLEEFIGTRIRDGGYRAAIFAGPVFGADDPEYRGYRLPQQFWRIAVVDFGGGDYRVLSFKLSQDLGQDPDDGSAVTVQQFDPKTTRVSIEQIETLTGLDFGPVRGFPNLE